MESGEKIVVRCGESLGISAIATLHAQLRNAFEKHRRIVVQVDDASDVDVTFFQLLLSASRTAETLGREFAVFVTEESHLISKMKNAGHLHRGLAIVGDPS
jgi:anti-anti-sigma regulatory factor